MTPEFERAIGGMANVAQWFVWRLQWDAVKGKYQKTPCAHDGSVYRIDASVPSEWNSYAVVADVVGRLNANMANGELRYAMGFWLTADCGYWFLDIDHSNSWGESLAACYPLAMRELSSSGKGLHVIGRGTAPPHRNKPPREIAAPLRPLELEFYTDGRGIAFGLSGKADGCADAAYDVAELVRMYFPPREAVDSEARPEWRGPTDDDVLIERMLSARVSAAAAFGGKPTLPQLWRGECEHNSESDMALASHLAFWTGCDNERIVRLMRRSGMVRDKWNERRPGGTYLTFTVGNACDSCENVYQEPARNLAIQTEMYGGSPEISVEHAGAGQQIPAEMFERVNSLLNTISACGTDAEMVNDVFPLIMTANIPGLLQERIVGAVRQQMKSWGNVLSVGKLRATLFPPAMRSEDADKLPEWAQTYCYVTNGDKFFNTENGQMTTMLGFQAVYGRLMKINDQGRRENAAERCLHFWGMPIVEQIGYRPDQGPFYTWDGVSYANLYSPSSVPEVTAYTPEGIAAIDAFQKMLYDMCGRRQDVFTTLLYWFAHNVQYPGKKIRWSPIIKGVHGDGKTLAFAVLRSAMGYRNVSTTSNATLSNSGGFTDWAIRGAVNVIEEIMLKGAQRHQLYNAMKEFITNGIVDINVKGGKPMQAYNCTNHAATTNHNDAIPMEKTDRRWFVIYTPWSSLSTMMLYCGLDAAGWKARTDAIDHALHHCAGELRAWLLGVTIPDSFDINGSALMTPEKMRMMASGEDDAERAAAQIISEGAYGITDKVFSSSLLNAQLQFRSKMENFDIPQTSTLNYMLTRLGYSKLEKYVKWKGGTHTIWLKNGIELTNDQIRLELDTSNPTSNLLPT